MPRTIERTRAGFRAGTFQSGYWGKLSVKDTEDEASDAFDIGKPGSIKQIVSDGDTVNVSSANNFPIRFLGIDTPESKLPKPNSDTLTFASTNSEIFQQLLSDPFSADFDPIPDMDDPLLDHLNELAADNAAEVHHRFAKDAERALEDLIQSDREVTGNGEFFLAFAYDALDFFGRLLAYVHPNQPGVARADRLGNYNERLLETGLAAPYFIFPNVDPFRTTGSPVDAVKLATDQQTILNSAPTLVSARAKVNAARIAEAGIFNPVQPIGFQAFEFRFLARRTLPSRWLVDLSKNDKKILPPQKYIQIPKLEDRLFIPSEFVPLFHASGWNIDGNVML